MTNYFLGEKKKHLKIHNGRNTDWQEIKIEF